MPLLRFRAIEAKDICAISTDLVDELQALLQCPRDYFTLESVQSLFIQDGGFVNGSPVIEIAWFDRGQEIQDKVAAIVTNYMHSAGYKSVDVIFTKLEEQCYYENGKHF
jgi:hypothetical protein